MRHLEAVAQPQRAARLLQSAGTFILRATSARVSTDVLVVGLFDSEPSRGPAPEYTVRRNEPWNVISNRQPLPCCFQAESSSPNAILCYLARETRYRSKTVFQQQPSASVTLFLPHPLPSRQIRSPLVAQGAPPPLPLRFPAANIATPPCLDISAPAGVSVKLLQDVARRCLRRLCSVAYFGR